VTLPPIVTPFMADCEWGNSTAREEVQLPAQKVQ